MRNGNPSGSCVADPVPVSSYRTYEEWKPGQLLAFNSVLSVLTVPMRNGNNTFCSCAFVSSTTFLPYLWGMETESPLVCTVHVVMFLPYLWGMETATNRPSKGRKWVLTVPMRNGNVYSEDELISRKLVLTVPMRNGNQYEQNVTVFSHYSSYRTYEEWKRFHDGIFWFDVPGSYRTYEEWKLCWRSERTGEILKVLTVPMRNGNFVRYALNLTGNVGSYRTYEEWKRL